MVTMIVKALYLFIAAAFMIMAKMRERIHNKEIATILVCVTLCFSFLIHGMFSDVKIYSNSIILLITLTPIAISCAYIIYKIKK